MLAYEQKFCGSFCRSWNSRRNRYSLDAPDYNKSQSLSESDGYWLSGPEAAVWLKLGLQIGAPNCFVSSVACEYASSLEKELVPLSMPKRTINE